MSERASLLGFFAHPDDEVYRCGGTLALLAERGVRVQVLTATRGQAGSCGDPPLCGPGELGVVREKELRCACETLGIAPPRLMDYQDGDLAQVDEEQAVAQILTVMRQVLPQVVITMPAHGLSGHPDHIAVSRWATLACERAVAKGIVAQLALYYLAVSQSVADRLGLGQLRATPDEQISVTMDVGSVFELKMAAIRCHATQLAESPILRAPLERQRLFLGTEHLERAVAPAGGQDALSAWVGQPA